MPRISIAMLDKDHHIHLVPADRVLMLTIEHSAMRKVEHERFEVECYLRLSVEGFPHPLEDAIRFTFAASKVPGPELMAELAFVQNHIIKYVLDTSLEGDLCTEAPDEAGLEATGITISYAIKELMLKSQELRQVLARHSALPDTMIFTK